MSSWGQEPCFLGECHSAVGRECWMRHLHEHSRSSGCWLTLVAGKRARALNAQWIWVRDLAGHFSSEWWAQGFGLSYGYWSDLTGGGVSLCGQENNDLKVRGKLAECWFCFSHPACRWGRRTSFHQVARTLQTPPLCCMLRICTFLSPPWTSLLSFRF